MCMTLRLLQCWYYGCRLPVLLCWEAGLRKEPTAFILGAKESLGSHSTNCRCYLLHKIESNANHKWSVCVTPALTIFCQLSTFVSHNRTTPAASSYGSPVLSLGRQENSYLFRDLLRLFRKRLRKATMSVVMSVCLSFCPQTSEWLQNGPLFLKFLMYNFYRLFRYFAIFD